MLLNPSKRWIYLHCMEGNSNVSNLLGATEFLKERMKMTKQQRDTCLFLVGVVAFFFGGAEDSFYMAYNFQKEKLNM